VLPRARRAPCLRASAPRRERVAADIFACDFRCRADGLAIAFLMRYAILNIRHFAVVAAASCRLMRQMPCPLSPPCQLRRRAALQHIVLLSPARRTLPPPLSLLFAMADASRALR